MAQFVVYKIKDEIYTNYCILIYLIITLADIVYIFLHIQSIHESWESNLIGALRVFEYLKAPLQNIFSIIKFEGLGVRPII